MYRVTLYLNGNLVDFFPKAIWDRVVSCSFKSKRSVKDLLESNGVPHTEVGAILADGKAVTFDYLVQDGDRLEVFQATEFLQSDGDTHLQPVILGTPKLICDDHLEKLARRLRLLGFDVLFEKGMDDSALAALAQRENRILLTRDRRLLMRKNVSLGMHVWHDDPEKQVLEVLGRLRGTDSPGPFGRCTVCNGELRRIPASSPEYEEALNEAPPRVRIWRTEYDRCDSCKRLYWKGTHYAKLRRMVQGYLGETENPDNALPSCRKQP